MSNPRWGKQFAKHLREAKVLVDEFGQLLASIQKIIFSLKKLWFSLCGLLVIENRDLFFNIVNSM